jgi:hypothetical protein
MSVAAIIEHARIMGVSLRVVGDIIKVRGPRPAVEQILPTVREHKPDLLVALAAPAKPMAPTADFTRTCTGCRNVSRFGNCKRPVEAGLTERFELVAATEGYAARCPAYEANVAQTERLDPTETSGHWLILQPDQMERWFSPPATRAELEARYPGAVLIALPET